MDADRIQRCVRRIAYNIAEEYHHNPIVLLGINDRGFAVASRLHLILSSILENSCELARVVLDGDKQIGRAHV